MADHGSTQSYAKVLEFQIPRNLNIYISGLLTSKVARALRPQPPFDANIREMQIFEHLVVYMFFFLHNGCF